MAFSPEMTFWLEKAIQLEMAYWPEVVFWPKTLETFKCLFGQKWLIAKFNKKRLIYTHYLQLKY